MLWVPYVPMILSHPQVEQPSNRALALEAQSVQTEEQARIVIEKFQELLVKDSDVFDAFRMSLQYWVSN